MGEAPNLWHISAMQLRVLALAISSVIGAVALCASLALVFWSDRLEYTAYSIRASVESVYGAEELRTALLSYNRQRNISLLEHRPLPEFPQEALDRHYAEIEQYVVSEAENELLDEVKRRIGDYFEQLAATENVEPVQTYLQLTPPLNRAISSLDRLVELNRGEANALASAAARENQWVDRAAAALIAIIAILVAAGLFVTHRFLYRPIGMLKGAIERYRQGSLPDNPCRRELVVELRDIGGAFSEMAQKLSQQRQSQLRSIGGVVHDLRNPLAAMRSALNLLADPELSPQKRDEIFSLARRQVDHLLTLTKDLVQIASAESGAIPVNRKECDVAETVRNAIGVYVGISPLHDISVDVPESCPAYCDPERITQVLNNLVSNALKYSPQGGAIRVVMKKSLDVFTILVADEGIGIAAAELPRIFEPFYRSESAGKSFEGSGLGLSLVRRIVEAHGGIVEVESRIGVGTAFRITIPQGLANRSAETLPAVA